MGDGAASRRRFGCGRGADTCDGNQLGGGVGLRLGECWGGVSGFRGCSLRRGQPLRSITEHVAELDSGWLARSETGTRWVDWNSLAVAFSCFRGWVRGWVHCGERSGAWNKACSAERKRVRGGPSGGEEGGREHMRWECAYIARSVVHVQLSVVWKGARVHYSILCYTESRLIILYYTPLHFTTWHYISLNNTASQYITCPRRLRSASEPRWNG